MSRPPTGQVVFNPNRKDPTFGGRVRYKGHRPYFHIGTLGEGWTHAKARDVVEAALQDIRAGRDVPFLDRKLKDPGARGGGPADDPLAHACMYQRRALRLVQLALERQPPNPEPIKTALDLATELGNQLGRAIRIN